VGYTAVRCLLSPARLAKLLLLLLLLLIHQVYLLQDVISSRSEHL
jgi:hypothetical protein